MPGFLTNGLPLETVLSGAEQLNIDTMLPQGEDPASAALTTLQMALFAKLAAAPLDKTTVAGSRYYTGVSVGTTVQVHGITALVGSTGGTDKWLAELHDAEGNLLATSATAGATVGTEAVPAGLGTVNAAVAKPGVAGLARCTAGGETGVVEVSPPLTTRLRAAAAVAPAASPA